LAARGMTGPTEAFEGRHGLFEQVTGRFALAPLAAAGGSFGVERSGIKYLPTEYNSQLPLYQILQLRQQVPLEQIEAIEVEVYHFTFTEIGSEPAKWRPTTRETADHSLPYMLAVTLLDGGISVESFTPERIADPRLPPLMDRIRIRENADFSRRYPETMDCRITVRTRDGRSLVEHGSYPRGHGKNPMSDAEVEAKFHALCANVLPRAQADALLRAVWAFDSVDMAGLWPLLRRPQAG